MSLKTYYIKTFGCQMNYADSEKIHMILMGAGFRKVIDPTKADIIVMNTCSVRQKGEDKVFGFIHEIERYHKKLPVEGIPVSSSSLKDPEIVSGGRKVLFGITGCMVRKTGMAKRYLNNEKYKRQNTNKITLLESSDSLMNYDDELFLRSPLIDFVFRIEEVAYLTKILSLISGEDVGNDAKFNEYLQVKQLQENPASANVIIQTGCDNYCTYCIVPYTRGREVSRPKEEILVEIRDVVSRGTKEVTFLGQNVNSYGKETKVKLWNEDELIWTGKDVKTPFRDLLEAINEVEGLDRIRFTSSNPHDMTRDILDAHFDLPRMCNSLHFALQSGSDTMLGRMNRKHTYADFKAQLDYLRARDPIFSISTDIIVGFPEETEEEFQATVQAMRECQFDFAYIARYSPRSGTFASERYEDDISSEEKTRRWTILNDILRETVRTRNLLMIGHEEQVLISGVKNDKSLLGRTRNWKEVVIPQNIELKIGDIVKIKIVGLDGWILRGEMMG